MIHLGTFNSTSFSDKERSDGSGKRDIYFNGPGDGANHGHVVQREGADGNTVYDYVRDVEGNEYNVSGGQ